MTASLGEDYISHYGVKGMKWGRRKVRPDEAQRKAIFSPRAKKIAMGSAAVVGAAAVAVIAAKSGGIKISSIGGLTDRNSGLYQAAVAGRRAANVTMSATRNTKVSDIPKVSKAISSNPQLKELTAGAGKAATTASTSLKDLADLDNVRRMMDDPNFIWEL